MAWTGTECVICGNKGVELRKVNGRSSWVCHTHAKHYPKR